MLSCLCTLPAADCLLESLVVSILSDVVVCLYIFVIFQEAYKEYLRLVKMYKLTSVTIADSKDDTENIQPKGR